jgi:tetratricopeptide (TPR) repeat protein
VWDVASGVEIARKTGGLFTGVAFSPDGAYLAAAEATSIEPSAWIWETPNASLLARSIRRVAASLKLGWRTDLDSVAVARIIHEQGVDAIAFGPDKDKSLLATATSDGIVRVLPWQSQDLVKAACGRLTRNLTWEEWLQYLESDGNYKVCKELPIHSSIIKAGRDLARNGNAKGALLILRKVHNETNHDSPLNPSDPNLRLDPEADVLVAEAQGLLGRGDVGQAVAKFKEALAIAPSLSFNSEPEARHSVASMLVEEGKRFAEQVKVREAVVAYGEAQQFDSTWEISFDAWDTLCRCGSLGGNVDDDMVNACERAVERAPEDKKIFSRDARGRVYAVRGKRSEASQDFQAVVQWSRENDAYDDYGKRRDEWIAELQKEKGKDTINKATFEALRYDPYSNFGCVLPE